MAKAKVTCKCKICGELFEMSTTKNNRKEADKWEEWAIENFDTCRNCYRASKVAALEAKYSLPQISGVSEKQIAYAKALREKYLFKEENSIDNFIASLRNECVSRKIIASGKSVSEYLKDEYCNNKAIMMVCMCLYSSKAREIIDVLKEED